MRGLRLLGLLAAAALLAACSGAKDHVEPPAELVAFEPSLKVQRLWSRDLSGSSNHRHLTFQPWIGEQTVFVAEPDGGVSALNRDTGKLLWETELGLSLSAGVGGDGVRVYVAGEDGELLALSAEDGSELWRVQLSTEVLAVPSAGFDVVVARSIDGRISTIDAETGGELWNYKREVPTLTLRGNSPAQLVPGGVLLPLDSGRLLALALDSGKVVWETRLGTPSGRSVIERLNDADAALDIDLDYIYAANYQGVVAQVSPRNGRLNWTRDISTVRNLRVADGNVYVTDERGHIWGLDSSNGASRWKQDKLTARYVTGVAALGDYLVVGDLQGYLHWMARSDGRFVARNQHSDERILSAPVVSDNTLFVQDASGTLAAYRLPAAEE